MDIQDEGVNFQTVMRDDVIFAADTEVIQIPDGIAMVVPEGTAGWIMQVLGGNFTVRLDTGQLVRVDGKNAATIGQEIPEEAKRPETAPGDFDAAMVWDELKTCYDPEIPVNIVDLGLIYACDVQENGDGGKHVMVTMTLTAPGCGMGQILKDDVEYKVAHIPGVSKAEVELVFDPPWSPERMSEEAQLELGFF